MSTSYVDLTCRHHILTVFSQYVLERFIVALNRRARGLSEASLAPGRRCRVRPKTQNPIGHLPSHRPLHGSSHARSSAPIIWTIVCIIACIIAWPIHHHHCMHHRMDHTPSHAPSRGCYSGISPGNQSGSNQHRFTDSARPRHRILAHQPSRAMWPKARAVFRHLKARPCMDI